MFYALLKKVSMLSALLIVASTYGLPIGDSDRWGDYYVEKKLLPRQQSYSSDFPKALVHVSPQMQPLSAPATVMPSSPKKSALSVLVLAATEIDKDKKESKKS